VKISSKVLTCMPPGVYALGDRTELCGVTEEC